MYKCNSREIHYASLHRLSGVLATAWGWGAGCVLSLAWSDQRPLAARASAATQMSGCSIPARGGR